MGRTFKVPSFEFYVENVIVAQNEQKVLGFSFTGGGKQELSFVNSITSQMKWTLGQCFPESENKKPMTVVINKIKTLCDEKHCQTQLSLTFVTKENEILYTRLITGNVERTKVKNRFPYPVNVGINILNTFESCFKDFQQYYEKGNLTKDIISKEDLSVPLSPDSLYSIIFNRSGEKKGVIYSHTDFINFQVDDSHEFTIAEKAIYADKSEPFKVQFEKRFKDEHWGVYDGQHYYKHIKNNHYEKLTRDTINGLTIELDHILKVNNSSASGDGLVMMGGMVGGFIGAFVVSMIVENQQPEYQINIEEDETFRIDPFTGSITRKLENAFISIYHLEGDGNHPIFIYVDDKKIGEVTKGNFLQVKLNDTRVQTIYLESTDGVRAKALTLDPDLFKVYIAGVKNKYVYYKTYP